MSDRFPTTTMTLVGGPTLLLEIGGLRFLTDPTFDPAGSEYVNGPVHLKKQTAPALIPGSIGAVDVVLLSHDLHADNLDHAGRAFLPSAGKVFTTASGAGRLGGNAIGLAPWESTEIIGTNSAGQPFPVRITATPARHGPEGIEAKAGEVIGFVLEWKGQEKGALYLSGDTVWYAGIEEIARRFSIGTAVLFLGGAQFDVIGPHILTMNGIEGAKTAQTLNAKTVIPIHYEGWEHFSDASENVPVAFAEAGLKDHLLWLEAGIPTSVAV